MNILAALINTISDVDSYKLMHWLQIPEGTEYISSYIEARSSEYSELLGEEYDYAEFFGLQAFLKDRLSVPITQVQIDIMTKLSAWHLGNEKAFNREGWQYILDQYGGRLPVEIRAIPEGTVLPTSKAMVQIINTDTKVAWLSGYVETQLLRADWYTTTTATKSRIGKHIIGKYLDETSDNPKAINFMLHDFGSRGASSSETAALGGMAHLMNFMGTDTVTALFAVIRHYEPEFEKNLSEVGDPDMAFLKTITTLIEQGVPPPAYSVEASEHSTMTILGKEGEKEQIKKLIDHAKEGRIVSIVSDSYDYFHNVINVFGEEFKEDILEAGRKDGKVVIRPDSGEPVDVVLKTLKILEEKFGCTVNSKGYKVLPPYIGILQGDGINLKSMKAILQAMKEAGYSAENVVFGMGGGLLQKQSRDDLNFAQKASAARIKGVWYDIYKDPVTSENVYVKKSKRGLLSTIWDGTAFQTKKTADLKPGEKDLMEVVFRNGAITKLFTLREVRNNAEYFSELLANPPVAPIKNPHEMAQMRLAI